VAYVASGRRGSARLKPAGVLSIEPFQQRSRSPEIGSVQTFGEPAINRSEQIPRCRRVSAFAPVARQGGGGTQFPNPRLLPVRDRYGGRQRRFT